MEWPSGEATACKAVHTGSIPVSTSKLFGFPGAISSAGERFPDTEEVTGSIPVSRTTSVLLIRRSWASRQSHVTGMRERREDIADCVASHARDETLHTLSVRRRIRAAFSAGAGAGLAVAVMGGSDSD